MQTEETQMQQAFEEAQAKAQQQEATQQQVQDAEVQAQEQAQASDEQAVQSDANNEEQEIVFDPKQIIAENEQLKASLAQAQAQAKAEKEQLVRAFAECENQKKRIEADVERERKFGNEKILKALIPVVDSLELALVHADPNNEAAKSTIEGVQNTVTLLLKELKGFGVEAVDPTGKAFDPNLHQAISMVPSAEVEANCVINVMQKGYTLNGRVVRPAMVIVSSGAPAGSAPKAESSLEENRINIEA
ncbi:MAG: nucleotide exchange factor GrpE [Succinivibrio sp.]